MAVVGAIGERAASFFAWWLGELAGLWPKRLRPTGRRERSRLVLVLTGSRVVLQEPGPEGEHELGHADAADGDLTAALGAALGRSKRRGRDVTIRLGPDGGLRRTLELPLAARGNLEQLLQFEMDRLTPFRSDQVYTAHRVANVDAAAKRLRAEVHIAPRERVDQALALARDLGLQAKRVELAGADEAGPALDLLPDHTGERARPTTHLVRALALLTLLLVAAAVVIPLYRQQSLARSLAEQVEAARIEAEKSLVLREQLDELTQTADFVVKARRDRPMVTAIVAELTRVIPDQAHVSQLSIDEDTVQLHGLARAASGIIGQLEQSDLFDAPRFRSPVTIDPGENLERFHIEVEIQSRGAGS